MMETNIHIRQTGLIDPLKLTMPIALIGAGAIGSWTALALLKLGCQDLTVIDFDGVETHNAGTQIYKAADAGSNKIRSLLLRLSFLTETAPKVIETRWTSALPLTSYPLIISAVDNMATRNELFQTLKGHPHTLIDARMGGNAIEIYTVQCGYPPSIAAYEKTLFSDEEALPIRCSERSVIYNVFVIAGLIGDLVGKIANGQVYPPEILVDLYNFTLFT